LTFSNVRKLILWGNRFITFENKYLFFKEWIIIEIFFVNDKNGKNYTRIYSKKRLLVIGFSDNTK
jgi:hypothetical protein